MYLELLEYYFLSRNNFGLVVTGHFLFGMSLQILEIKFA